MAFQTVNEVIEQIFEFRKMNFGKTPSVVIVHYDHYNYLEHEVTAIMTGVGTLKQIFGVKLIRTEDVNPGTAILL
ncbi:MAG: hypothetical protein JST78_09645 [Bacteroidetes bacterium]|nr:hypothetical protein [Bacteroidota bacterium]